MPLNLYIQYGIQHETFVGPGCMCVWTVISFHLIRGFFIGVIIYNNIDVVWPWLRGCMWVQIHGRACHHRIPGSEREISDVCVCVYTSCRRSDVLANTLLHRNHGRRWGELNGGCLVSDVTGLDPAPRCMHCRSVGIFFLFRSVCTVEEKEK